MTNSLLVDSRSPLSQGAYERLASQLQSRPSVFEFPVAVTIKIQEIVRKPDGLSIQAKVLLHYVDGEESSQSILESPHRKISIGNQTGRVAAMEVDFDVPKPHNLDKQQDIDVVVEKLKLALNAALEDAMGRFPATSKQLHHIRLVSKLIQELPIQYDFD